MLDRIFEAIEWIFPFILTCVGAAALIAVISGDIYQLLMLAISVFLVWGFVSQKRKEHKQHKNRNNHV